MDVICDMLGNYNTMIAANTASIKKLEGDTAESSKAMNEKFDKLLNHVKNIDERLKDIEDKTETHTEQVADLGQAVGAFVDTADILESRLGSIERRVSSIERLLIRSSKGKRKQANRE